MADSKNGNGEPTQEQVTDRLEKAELAMKLCDAISGKPVSQVLDCLAIVTARVLMVVFAASRQAFGVLGFSFLGRLFHYIDDNPLKDTDLGLMPDNHRTH